MDRADVNPWEWSKSAGFSQAVELTRADQVLVCSGQTAVGPDGSPPKSSDMGDQVRQAFSNLGTVLETQGMTFADIVRLTLYTTDMGDFLSAYPAVRAEFMGANLPAATLLEVSQLAFPALRVELEATAAR